MKVLIFGGKLTLLRNGTIAAAVIALAAATMVLAPRAQAAEGNISEFVTLKYCTIKVADYDADQYTVTIDGDAYDPGSTLQAIDFEPEATISVTEKGVDDADPVATGAIEIPSDCFGGYMVMPVTIDGCTVTVPSSPPMRGVTYFQDKGNDPYLPAGKYDAKNFYPSTMFTAKLPPVNDSEVVGEWTIDVPEKCAPSSDDSAKKADSGKKVTDSDKSVPTKAPAAGM